MTSEYDGIKAINWSSLKHIRVSPLLYKWRLDHPEPSKKVFVVGNAIHTKVLEPEKFDERYGLWDTLTKKGDKVAPRSGGAWADWQEENAGLESLLAGELDVVNLTAKAVRNHKTADALLTGGRREESLTWIDAVTGMKCKGRVDYIRPDMVTDLKSARSVEPYKFDADAAKLMYHGQLALYHDGAIASGKIPKDARPPSIVAVEKEGPFDVAVYDLSYEDLAVGRALYRDLMRQLAECIEADYWPGVCPTTRQLNLPAWAPGMFIPEVEEAI